MTEPETHTLEAPGAVLHYDVRRNDASTQPVLLLIGSPMGAEGFVTQAGHFTDRTVVTYDPRGAGRSKRTDGGSETAVEEQADDLHRLVDAVSAVPVDIFASSGGPSTHSPWWPSTPSRSGSWWRTSRQPPGSCRTARRCWPRARASRRPTCGWALARRWPGSSRSVGSAMN